MTEETGSPRDLRHSLVGLIAGRGDYPLILAREAVSTHRRRVIAFAFKGETRAEIGRYVDQVFWLQVGALQSLLDSIQDSGVNAVVMAGQIAPRHVFSARPDSRMWSLLEGLPVRNAETIFGAVVREIEKSGVSVLPAWSFMEQHLAEPGILSGSEPTAEEWCDIRLAQRVASALANLDVGQAVAVKAGVVLAVEAFEGTDAMVRRAGRLAGRRAGGVVVKVAKRSHDVRFDIPVVGRRTIEMLRKWRFSVLGVEAGRTILLDKGMLMREAGQKGLKVVGLGMESTGSNDGR
ncbi:MAG TPA: LpxI family protein [Kiritimatiellae bacterium]|nr:LpxI family protein [Kiritimatiellia bacterium]